MAKYFKSAKWKRRLAAGLAVALSATLSLGILSACGKTADNSDDVEDEPALPTDTQLIKNGDFEFYSEMKKEQDKRRAFISTPQSWSASAESPTSKAASGIVSTKDWDFMTKSTKPLIRDEDRKKTDSEGNEVDVEYGDGVLTEAAKQYALAGWDEASLYDRLEFYSFFDIDADSDFEKYDDYKYSIDFDDVRYLAEEAGDELTLHYTTEENETAGDTKEVPTGVLMIHNHYYDNNVSGTAKYYTSSTDVTLNAGTAAKVSVWVKTIGLEHYNQVPVTKRGGAYISVTNNVGSTQLDQMQINDIITENNSESNAATNGWQQYTMYIRANTFATTTFRIVLGLGRGTSDDRYEAVDGIALFDDLECELIEEAAFEDAVYGAEKVLPESGHVAQLTDREAARKFYSTDKQSGEFDTNTNYALDLKAQFETLDVKDPDIALTQDEDTGFTSESVDPTLTDNRGEDPYDSVVKLFENLDALKGTTNNYLKSIVAKDFAAEKFPFGNAKILMMLSSNGAAYTAKLALPEFTLEANSRRLVSFWVKTSEMRSGRSGAGAMLIDGENKPVISPFDSTTVDKVNVGESVKDIWDGWVQCFFCVENDSDEEKTFTLNLTYGPTATAIADAERSTFGEGYAAFTNFEVYDLTRAQYNYAATGTYAQKTTLTGEATEPAVFDSAAASGNTLEEGLARPANYTGALAGSDVLVANSETKNPTLKELNESYGIYTGMLSSDYAEKYLELNATENPWMTTLNAAANNTGDAKTWWKSLFGSKGSTANPAQQPLVLLNTNTEMQPSYGFYAKQTTISANAATKISLRVKVAAGTTAYIYLTDVSGTASEGYNQGLKATLPTLTYWYDDDGNIVNMDPDAKDFDENGKILYELQENGLYKNAQDTTDTALYANLTNFDKDDDGNYVTTAGTPVFYYDKETNAYYAYREEAGENSYTYKTEVKALPAENFRYNYVEHPEAVIAVKGDDFGGEWVTVSFYVQAGTEEKNYRLELWAGQRDYDGKTEGKTTGFPAGGYVFFDRCTTSTPSNFSDLLAETEESMLAYQDGTDAYPYRDAKDAEKLAAAYGRYYTFTLYDSPNFLRYDATLDEDGDGNPWRNYKQSDESEKLAYLNCVDTDGSVLGTAFPTVSTFIDYSVSEKEVDEAPSLNDTTDEDDSSSDTTTTTTGDSGNIWLYLASALLAVAILFAIGAVIFRKFWSKHKKTAKVKAPKQPRAPKPAKVKEEKEEEPAKDETPAKAPDENDPYNE